jgi:hypothetical protein
MSNLGRFEKDAFSVRPSLVDPLLVSGMSSTAGVRDACLASHGLFFIAAADLSELVRLCRSLCELLEMSGRFAR